MGIRRKRGQICVVWRVEKSWCCIRDGNNHISMNTNKRQSGTEFTSTDLLLCSVHDWYTAVCTVHSGDTMRYSRIMCWCFRTELEYVAAHAFLSFELKMYFMTHLSVWLFSRLFIFPLYSSTFNANVEMQKDMCWIWWTNTSNIPLHIYTGFAIRVIGYGSQIILFALFCSSHSV